MHTGEAPVDVKCGLGIKPPTFPLVAISAPRPRIVHVRPSPTALLLSGLTPLGSGAAETAALVASVVFSAGVGGRTNIDIGGEHTSLQAYSFSVDDSQSQKDVAGGQG